MKEIIVKIENWLFVTVCYSIPVLMAMVFALEAAFWVFGPEIPIEIFGMEFILEHSEPEQSRECQTTTNRTPLIGVL